MFKPMKPPAGVLEDEDLCKLTMPLIGQFKYDGIRASVQNKKILSSTLKPIPNVNLQKLFGNLQLEGIDGELIVGSPNDPSCFNKSTSVIMSEEADISDVNFIVFDYYNESFPDLTYDIRYKYATSILKSSNIQKIKIIKNILLNTIEEVLIFEKKCVDEGYEGIILRCPKSKYKQGRSTIKEQSLLRRKPFMDAEAIVVGMFEEMQNKNEAYKNELGKTKRSSCKLGMVGTGTLGGFNVIGLTAFQGKTFNIGGFGTDKLKKELWISKENLCGKIIKFKYQKYGSKDVPRIPIAIGFRDESDITL